MNQADRLNQTVLAEKSQERRKRNRIKARRNPISQITPSLHPHSPERASQVCFSCCCPREVRWAESALKGSLLHRRLKQVSLHPHLWIQAFSPSSIAFSCFPRTSIPREVQRQSVTMLIRNPRSLLKPHFSSFPGAQLPLPKSASYGITWRFPRLFAMQFYILYFLECIIWLILAEIAPKCCRPWNVNSPCEVTFYSISSLLTRHQGNIFTLLVFCPSALQIQLIFSSRLQSTRQISICIYTHIHICIYSCKN